MKTDEELQISAADNFTLALDAGAAVESRLTSRTVNPSLKLSYAATGD
ncbi:MAG: hypothetical protein M3T96_04100 [Acidobacteriota bacterium]|nr:hypothetical protein [Acidobacteriota bacterium]